MASEVDTIEPAMILSPSRRASAAVASASVKPAGLVELDVDRVVPVGDRGERGAVMHQLVGADRDGVGDMPKSVVVARREGLLDELDPGRRRCRHQPFKIGSAPGLVGIGDEPRHRHGIPNGGKAGLVPVTAELELEQRIAGRRLGLRRHHVWRRQGNGEGRGHGVERLEPGKCGRAPSRELGVEVPQRAIEGIAGGAGRKQRLQRGPVEAIRYCRAAVRDGPRHAVDALAVARVRHALAAAHLAALADGRHHDDRLVLGAARDGKAASDRPPLDADAE